MSEIKQGSAYNVSFFLETSQDSITGLTGATPAVTLSKAGGAFAAPVGSVTEIGLGWYYLALAAGDTNTLGDLILHATAPGADPADVLNQVLVDVPGGSVSSVTGNVAGNVVGSVASVAGAVASVTGNVGGNVAGSVASVTATVSANLVSILGSAITGTASQLAAAFTQFFNVVTPTSTMNQITLVSTVTALTNAVSSVTGNVGGNVVGSVASVTGNVGGNVTGSVGSVSGNVSGSVASVTGNVGGNVVGSVASVVATVSANLTQILGSAITGTASQLAAAFTHFFNVVTPTSTMNEITLVDTVTTLTNPVASVTGAVGSVTGSVGSVAGNVAGSVNSVNAPVTLAAAQIPFKKNTAIIGFTFPMFTSSGLPATGLAVTAQRIIDGAAIANCANAVTEVSNGYYAINLAASDLNGNSISFLMSATGAVVTDFTVITQ